MVVMELLRPAATAASAPPSLRKRKAETQDAHNERLSKRLGLLNLGQGGTKLYVPVESPRPPMLNDLNQSALPLLPLSSPSSQSSPPPPPAARAEQDVMQLDDSKYKVYIYNLDDELSSESETDDAKLVFLPDIEKHLRQSRIPPRVLPNSEGELTGKQLVLYSVPSSLSVPEERDSVRKAIIEARARARAGAGAGAKSADVPVTSMATPSFLSIPPYPRQGLPDANRPPLNLRPSVSAAAGSTLASSVTSICGGQIPRPDPDAIADPDPDPDPGADPDAMDLD